MTARRWQHTGPILALATAAGCVRADGAALHTRDAGCPPVLEATPTELDPAERSARTLIAEGRHTFRYDTFGDEAFWGDALQLHRAIAGAENGGIGVGLAPSAALALGLKVDLDAIPPALLAQLGADEVDLEAPATTLALLRIDAVIGVEGFFEDDGTLRSIGIQCALCHSSVDDALAPGIGHRLDGWPNRDLDVGALIALAPDLSSLTTLLEMNEDTLRALLRSWGRGRFDAALVLDGRAHRPDGGNASTLIPAAFGLTGVNLHTYTGWGAVSYWNAYVANLQMRGIGTFYDPRLDDATRFPVAARARLGHVATPPHQDRISPRLGALQFYQLALPIPAAPQGSFDPVAAERGRYVFEGAAECARCHVPPTFTEPGWNMHSAEELGIDDFQASRSPEGGYRTTPLRGLFVRTTGGFYHDGRFATLADVVAHYDEHFALDLSVNDRADLVQYLMSL